MTIYEKKLNPIWYKASVLGSIWASFEIIFGSFLHNIRFPMSGTILTVIAVIIIITFSHIWQEKGIILRAGIIAALMKSISPSAVLIGPMTGIFFEALLIEIILRLFGKNIFAYIISGVVALYSVLIHKIISLLILYGYDIIKITKNLYHFIIKQLNISNLSFIEGLLLLSTFYVGIGIFASIIGIYTGKKSNKQQKYEKIDFFIFKKDFLKENKRNNYSTSYIFLHLISITIIFLVINRTNLLYSAIISLIYILLCVLKYKKIFKHYKKTGFWLQIILLLIISILFYSGTQNLTLFNKEGFIAGITMIVRMFVIFTGFTSVSYELRNPLVKAILYRRGLGKLYHSLSLAFSVLPIIIKRNTKPKLFIKKPSKILSEMINLANSIYKKFISEIKYREIIIIKGEKNSGKTSFMKELSDLLLSENININGFLSIGKFRNNQKTEFYLEKIPEGCKKLLCTVKPIKTKIKTGKYYFNEQTVEFGNKILKNTNNEIVIIDEIGPLELKNKGWSESMEKLLEKDKITQIWVVRNKIIKDILKRYAITKAYIFEATKKNKYKIFEIIKNKKKATY